MFRLLLFFVAVPLLAGAISKEQLTQRWLFDQKFSRETIQEATGRDMAMGMIGHLTLFDDGVYISEGGLILRVFLANERMMTLKFLVGEEGNWWRQGKTLYFRTNVGTASVADGNTKEAVAENPQFLEAVKPQEGEQRSAQILKLEDEQLMTFESGLTFEYHAADAAEEVR